MGNFEIVTKFGGTSVLSPGQVGAHVAYHNPGAVVVSALGRAPRQGYPEKVTDSLLRYSEHEAVVIELMEERHSLLLQDMAACLVNEERRSRVLARGQRVIAGIGDTLRQWQAEGWPVEAVGESLTAQLYALCLGSELVESSEVIRTDSDGQLLVGVSEALIRDRFLDGQYVMAGFTGADEHGRVHTLGRNSSDTSAALLARALSAEECRIFSDVDGFMTADPANDESAQLIERLEFETVLAMAGSDRQPLHEGVCRLLGGTAVNVVLANTFGPPGNWGTVISNSPARLEGVLR